jgi:hypothetical protein
MLARNDREDWFEEGGWALSLSTRKLIVLSVVGVVFLPANLLVVTSWLAEHGVLEWAARFRAEFLTGTAITIVVALLILLVPASSGAGRMVG